MRYRLRTLMIASAVVPPVVALFWWLVAKTELLPIVPAIPIGVTFAALTAILITWLCNLADYLGDVSSGERKLEVPALRFKLRTLLIVLGVGPLFIAIVSRAALDARLLGLIVFAVVVAFPSAWLMSKVASSLIFYGSHEDNRK
jgi:hypothetical protein